ncbi:ScbA/BarX family gamma-butyrolactone biosynthesis protein [Streptomyces sp. RerS4]|uniref:ScbA/BarX family gamma-butyrolactone biosynthesis protein n=1 Tax=Streptomyces sp. RerS4 TaxID=2942449 RepID=UPI00201C38B3|nr:ScbA/BarX family gamma-butyrolactone biosynthesis protein [Streptomyces sp. RerS4]UQX05436.1 gamma-butyrolactone biosynthesis enzyme [Streptomyces sp. RerS4]
MPYVAPSSDENRATTRPTVMVPREYVHRVAVSEVFLTGWKPAAEVTGGATDGAEFVVRAQWPRTHTVFVPNGGSLDSMLLIESVRQAGTLLSHAEFGVPFGHQFLLWDMSVDADPTLFAPAAVPVEVELRMVCAETSRRRAALTGARYDVTVLRDGRAMATASASFRCIGPEVHRRLRAGRPTAAVRTTAPALAPATVGHTGDRNVLLAHPPVGSRTGNLWELRVDTGHPNYFDHPVDHVPGMVLLEAARQAARAVTNRPKALLLALRGRFTRYAEFDAPCWIEAFPETAEATGITRVRVHGTQGRQTVFTAELGLGDPA